MKKRKILATGAIATTFLLSSIHQAGAQTIQVPQARTQLEAVQSEADIEKDTDADDSASDIGVLADDEITSSQSKQTYEQILFDQGFNSSQIHKIFTKAKAGIKNKNIGD